MKVILVMFAILGVTACGSPSTPEQIARTYVQSIIDDDESSVAPFYAPDSVFPKMFWSMYNTKMRSIKAKYKDSKFAVRTLRCEEFKESGKTLCFVRPTKDGVDMPTTFVIHIKDKRILDAPSGDDTIK